MHSDKIKYQAITDSVGVPINTQSPLDMGGAFIWLFISFINHQEKAEKPTSAGSQQ
jgi:hypothetical protein